MVLSTLEILKRTLSKEMVIKFGQTGELMMDSGRTIKCMVKALSHGQMVDNTKALILMEKSKETEF